MTPPGALPYRQGVGLCLFSEGGLVLIAERRDRRGAWQMPQGGIQKGEAPEIAALRELKEEVGTDNAEIVAALPEKLAYEFPDWPRHGRTQTDKPYHGKYRGQQQLWFALRFLGSDDDINLEGEHEPENPEFVAWKWAPLAETVKLIVPFKRPIYERVATQFTPVAEAIRTGEKLPKWRP